MGRRTALAGIFVAVGGVAFFACSSSDGGPGPDPSGLPDGSDVTTGTDAMLEGGPGAGEGELQLLAISDLRGQLEPVFEAEDGGRSRGYGGLEALAAYFGADRARAPATLVVSSGDAFGATPILSSAFDDVPTARALDLLGATADALGEHDFARGKDKLKDLVTLGAFRVVSTNLDDVVAELGPKTATPFMLLDLSGQDGGPPLRLRVAILGLTNPDVTDYQFPTNTWQNFTVRDPVAAANRAAQDARLWGADLVVALAHVGATGVDAHGAPSGPLLDMAGQLDGVDVLIGGRTDVGVTTTVGAMTVVQPRARGRSYARVRVVVDASGVHVKEARLVDALAGYVAEALCDAGADSAADADGAACACPSAPCPAGFSCSDASRSCESLAIDRDPDASALLSTYRAALPSALDRPLAVTDAGFPEGFELSQETALGDLVADALLSTYAKLATPAQIALVPGARIQASLPSSYATDAAVRRTAPPFDLLVGDVQQVLPFGDAVVVRKMTGALLRSVLERSVAAAPTPSASFLQVAGIALTYSVGADAGSRLRSVTLLDGSKNIPPGDATEYLVVLPDWTSAGHDGYAMLAEDVAIPSRDLLTDVLAGYMKAQTSLDVPSALTRIVAVP